MLRYDRFVLFNMQFGIVNVVYMRIGLRMLGIILCVMMWQFDVLRLRVVSMYFFFWMDSICLCTMCLMYGKLKNFRMKMMMVKRSGCFDRLVNDGMIEKIVSSVIENNKVGNVSSVFMI